MRAAPLYGRLVRARGHTHAWLHLVRALLALALPERALLARALPERALPERAPLARALIVGLLALNAACSARGRTPSAPDPDPERARAALATLHVDNQSAQQLEVSYNIAGRSAARVVIGRVDAAGRAEMAPVPAGEPLILVARTNDGSELTLPPRTFAIDGAWTWRIDRNARFVPPARQLHPARGGTAQRKRSSLFVPPQNGLR